MRKPRARHQAMLSLVFAGIVLCVLLITMVIMGVLYFGLTRLGWVDSRLPPFVPLLITSLLIGTAVAFFVSHLPLRPLNTLIAGMNRLACGDYDIRIELGRGPVDRELTESFNALAAELRNTEMLRSDFVNGLSHEVKTPIVSIRGFARLLHKGGLPAEKQREYLQIIMDESTRLADMTTGMLNLTKLENQSILTDVTQFNLSEQLRNCVLLLEGKWNSKGIAVHIELDEHMAWANEEMLKQVWINLLDNAIKYAPEGGRIDIAMEQGVDSLTVSIGNSGSPIGEEDARHIFDKYWRKEPSQVADGTGIGLAIASRIAGLHGGTIDVSSSPEQTVFAVRLPKRGHAV